MNKVKNKQKVNCYKSINKNTNKDGTSRILIVTKMLRLLQKNAGKVPNKNNR